jgi:hypothetical protein
MYALKFDLLTMAGVGATRASALTFARLVIAHAWEGDVTRAIEPRLLVAFSAAGDAPLLIAALRFALPTELMAVLAATADAASALNLPPVADITACAGTLAIAPTLVFADQVSAPGATRANELRLPLVVTSAGA